MPAHRLTTRWWEEGPELLQDRLGEDHDLHRVRWLAARVEGIDQDGVHLRAAQIDRKQAEPPTVGRVVVDMETFRRLSRDEERVRDLQPGMHCEIGVYASQSRPDAGTTTLIRVLRPRAAEWSVQSVFESARYLRRVVPAR